MKLSKLLLILLVSIMLIDSQRAQTQQSKDDEDSRNAFLVTRPVKQTTKKAGGKPVKPIADRLGVGLTLYQKSETGAPRRVDSAQSFREGDGVRLMIESNTNGYLYVMTTENGQNPKMIFPDPRLNGGNNRVAAHTPYEVPSSREPDPNFQWFWFDKIPATENVYVILTRNPLRGVATGEQLAKFCRSNLDGCPWKPPAEEWARLQSECDIGIVESRNNNFGQALSMVERNSATRGLGLPPNAPAPSIVRIKKSAKDAMLVTRMDLIHK